MSIFNEFRSHFKSEVISILEELDLYHPPTINITPDAGGGQTPPPPQPDAGGGQVPPPPGGGTSGQ